MGEFSFKTALTDCRKIVETEPDDGWKDFTLRVLDDWREHGAVESNWHAIETAAMRDGQNGLSPFPLIEWVINQAVGQKKAVVEKNTCKQGKKEIVATKFELLEERALSSAEKDLRESRDPKYSGQVIEGAVKRVLAHKLRSDRLQILGRKPNPRRLFIADCRQMFIDTCGQPLDNVAQMLVEVISEREPPKNAVRNALKPTTKAARGRDIRKQK
jgi:hypothetical protein